MANEQSMLQKAQSISTILSALAIPLVLASTGYYVQKSIAENSLKKDYLDMAVGILRSGGESIDPEMRAWASRVVSEFSPIPFTTEAKMSLNAGLYLRPLMPGLPSEARQNDLGTLCDPSCIAAVAGQHNKWADELEEAGADGVEKIHEITDQSVQFNTELAVALDLSRIAGRACEAAYDAIREINNQ